MLSVPDYSRIFVDPPFRRESLFPPAWRAAAAHDHRWSHLWCETGDEDLLHDLALRIGMKRRWFQDRVSFPHYDLIPTFRTEAIKMGATEKRLRDWLKERKARG